MDFPYRIYTSEEVEKARKLALSGHKYCTKTRGTAAFKRKADEALVLIKTAGYLTFFCTYIREIREIDGFTQLRKAEATIWTNIYIFENTIDAASVFVQKANQMKEYLDGKLYFGGEAEKRSTEKRIEFIKILKEKSTSKKTKEECEWLLQFWKESSLIY
jgi:hypothetical protein